MKKKVISVTESYKHYLCMKNFDTQSFFVHRYYFLTDRLVPNKSKTSNRTNPDVANIAYRFCGYPNESVISELNQNIGNCRHLWNRMRSDYISGNEILSPAGYKKLEECSWLTLGDSTALCDIEKRFFKAVKDYKNGDKGFPNAKKKKYAKQSYTSYLSNASSPNLRLEGDLLYLPKISAPIKLNVHRPVITNGILKNCTITHESNGKWYFSLIYEYPLEEEIFTDNLIEFFETKDIGLLNHIGLDMSVPKLYIDSEGNNASYEYNDTIVEFEKFYRNAEKKLAREQRRLSHMVKDSSNYQKQKLKIARLHSKIKNQRNDFLHQLSIRLARTYDVISIEDLNLSGMKKSLRLGKSVSDNGWGNFTATLERKCRNNGALVIRVSKWFPSSKTCSCCGYIHHELELSDRTYVCPNCGAIIDRDINASINIDEEGLRLLLETTDRDVGDSLLNYSMPAPRQAVRLETQERYSA